MLSLLTVSGWLRLLTLGSASFVANLLWTTVILGQSTASSASTTETTETSLISPQVQDISSVPQLHQLELPSTNATDLLPACDNDLSDISNASFESHCQAQTELLLAQIVETTEDRLKINFVAEDPRAFTFGIGSEIGEPTALKGPTRLEVTEAIGQPLTLFPVAGFLQQGFGPGERLLLEILADPQAFGLDLSYSIAPKTIPGAFSINVQSSRSFVGVFREGDNDIKLPRGADPWVQREGGGVEYYFPFSSQFSLAGALNYNLVSVRPGAFTTKLTSRDAEGNRVTVSDDGQDTSLTLNFAGWYASLDDLGFPSKGSKLLFGIDTSIPIGDADISYGRFSGNFSQFIPLNIFGFTKGPRVLVLNVQGGTITGDVPPYEAFTIGGINTVRGYKGGDLGTGKSFLVASVEYRFPIANNLKVLVDFDLQGSLFFDYGTDFDTADQVIGKPAVVRDKKGNGYGYGLGVHAKTDFGLIRLEFAFNDRGNFTANFTVGDRY